MPPTAKLAPPNISTFQARAKVLAWVVVLIALIFFVDVSFEWVAFGGFYAIPILISLWLRSFPVTLGLSILCITLTLGEVVWLGVRRGADSGADSFTLQQLVANHAVEVSCLVVVCLIGYWRLRDERELEESRDTTQTTLASIAEAVITVDSSRKVTYMNPQAEQLTGVMAADALGKPIDSVLPLRDERPLLPPIDDLPPASSTPQLARAWLELPGRSKLRVELIHSPLRSSSGLRRGEVLVFRDVTDRERREHDMRTLAYRDTLTNLPNRLALSELLGLELAHARRNRGALAVLFIDLDDFKQVNDSLGHAAGDELLRTAASRLRIHLRETDTVARLGGDEFAVVLPGAPDVRDVEHIASKLIATLEEPVSFEGRAMRTSASIGMALFPSDAADADALLRRADEAMYRAKQQGGGRLVATSSTSRVSR